MVEKGLGESNGILRSRNRVGWRSQRVVPAAVYCSILTSRGSGLFYALDRCC